MMVHGTRDSCPDPAADNYDGSANIRPALGGWCQCAPGNKSPWDTSTANMVHFDAFLCVFYAFLY